MLSWLRGRNKKHHSAQSEVADKAFAASPLAENLAEKMRLAELEREREEAYQRTKKWTDRVSSSFGVHKLVNWPVMAILKYDGSGEKVCRNLKLIRSDDSFVPPPGNWVYQYLDIQFTDTYLRIEDKPIIKGSFHMGLQPEEGDPIESVRAFADQDDPLNSARLHRNRQRRLVSDLLFLGLFANDQLKVFGWRIEAITLVRRYRQVSNVPTNNDMLTIDANDETKYTVKIPEQVWDRPVADTSAAVESTSA